MIETKLRTYLFDSHPAKATKSAEVGV